MIARLSAIASILFMALWSGVALAERSVILVTDADCPVESLSNLQIRKAYLGISVSVDGYGIRPLRLTVDPDLNEIFFQTIVAMSEKSYERRALSLAVKFGTPRPAEFANLSPAIDALREATCGVLFVWASDAATIGESKTLRVLWRGL